MRRNADTRRACADTVSALKGLDEWKVVGQGVSLDKRPEHTLRFLQSGG